MSTILVSLFDLDVKKLWTYLESIFSTRIVILDGAMGTALQRFRFEENDYRMERFANHNSLLKNNNDVLNLT